MEESIYDIENEYACTDSIFDESDDRIRRIKSVVWKSLTATERRIILVYAHLGNIRDTAKVFKVSPTTIWNQIKKIQSKIKKKLEE